MKKPPGLPEGMSVRFSCRGPYTAESFRVAGLSTAIELGFWLAERGRADPGLRKGGAKLHRGPRLISDPLIIPIPRQGSTPRVKGNSPNLRLCSPAFHCIEQQEFGRAPFRAGFSQHIGAEVVLYDGDTDAVNCFGLSASRAELEE